MPVVTVKAEKNGPERYEQLVRRVEEKAAGLLAKSEDGVLVVYRGETASLYYQPVTGTSTGRSR
jgi:hypothetical protein